MNNWRLFKIYFFYLFIVVKIVLYLFKFVFIAVRYFKTFGTLKKFEIWWFVLKGLALAILLPNYFFRDINWMYYTFVINSVTTYWLSFSIKMRLLIAQERAGWLLRFNQIYFCTQICIIISFTGAWTKMLPSYRKDDKYDYFWLDRCDRPKDKVYRK